MTSVPTRRELLAWLLAFAMVITFAVSWTTNRAEGAHGDVRPEAGSESFAPTPVPEAPPAGTPRVVYIATGANFPDALGAGATAAMAMGPVLFVNRDSIPPQTLDELNRLAPNQIVIVGGTAVVSDTVQTTLEGLAFSPTVTRIAGADRFDTAAQLSASVFNTRGFYPRMTWAEAIDIVAGNGMGGVDQVALTVDHTTEVPGAYMIVASVDTWTGVGTADDVSCWLEVDGTALTSSTRWIGLDDTTGNDEENCSTTGFFVADTPGTYTLELVIGSASADVSWQYRNLVAYWNAYYPAS